MSRFASTMAKSASHLDRGIGVVFNRFTSRTTGYGSSVLLRNHASSRGIESVLSTSAHVGCKALSTTTLLKDEATSSALQLEGYLDTFVRRHIGPSEQETHEMLTTLGFENLEDFTDAAIPSSLRMEKELVLGPENRGEHEYLRELKKIGQKNVLHRSYIGQGYYNCITPKVILRNVMENPNWYTPYTPYQPEIAQGRLEALAMFQTLITDMTGFDIANASLLDEGTAAAEAMASMYYIGKDKAQQARAPTRKIMLVDKHCFPQTINVIQNRAGGLGIDCRVVDLNQEEINDHVFGVLVQSPNDNGAIVDFQGISEQVHHVGAMLCVASDLLSLTLTTPPAKLGADIAIGSAQRFGIPVAYGGPHAAFFATSREHVRSIPGRIIGLTRDQSDKRAYRMALQTREQHIRREHATSNICTSQALLANMAAFYAIYHGPTGLKQIASRVHTMAYALKHGLQTLNYELEEGPVNGLLFDTVKVKVENADTVLSVANQFGYNFRKYDDQHVGVSFDETTNASDLQAVLDVFSKSANNSSSSSLTASECLSAVATAPLLKEGVDSKLIRTEPFLTHPTFNKHHSEHRMLRYISDLARKDFTLTYSMIPLGSCTMKLNAVTEMIPITWHEYALLHPYVPKEQAQGYQELMQRLSKYFCEITGFPAFTLQPNSGSVGEYTGLLMFRAYQAKHGQQHRDICFIPQSAHGTNPASAVMAGYKVVVVKCLNNGYIDMEDFRKKLDTHGDNLGAMMITYPSTYGIFEEGIKELIDQVHAAGGFVYMDGANMNAQVGLIRPGDLGADACHLNLHKTFCIPHGGGGPGAGPVGVQQLLEPYLPNHPLHGIGPVASAPYGSSSILPISLAYLDLMGGSGVKKASQVAILNANYMKKRLEDHYPIRFHNPNGFVAHEFIIDLRPFKRTANVEALDVAKRLQDYGFHAPTMSWPVPNTMMIEPTESESKADMDLLCDAMIRIRAEIREIEDGRADKFNNVLKNAPHTAQTVTADEWRYPYSRQQAAFPAPWSKLRKFWPSISRVDDAYGDRNLTCTCAPIDQYM